MTVTVNGVSVGELTLRLPLVGSWEASLTADTTTAADVDGAAVIDFGGGVVLRGTASASADEGGKVTARVVGGAAGLGTVLEPRSYTSTTARVVLQDIARDCGEVLSTACDAATMARTLGGWARLAQTGKDALKRIADHLGVPWRHMLDGTIWLGPETWREVSPDHVVELEAPTEQAVTVAIESLAVLPGQTFRGSRVTQAEYRLSGSALRLTAKAGSARDPMAEFIGNMIKRETQTDFLALHPGRVVGQNGDGSLEIRTDAARMPHMSRVPLRHGLPGVISVEVEDGARVLVGFEGGDPAKAYACLFSGADKMGTIRLGGVVEVGGTEAVALAPLTDLRFTALELRVLALEAWGLIVAPPFPGGTGPPGMSVAASKLFTE